MGKLFMENEAVEFLKKTLEKERSSGVRIFAGGGGCCQWYEIAPVNNPLSGDVTFDQYGIKVHIEKELVNNARTIEIKFDENNGLRIEFKDQDKNGESINKISS